MKTRVVHVHCNARGMRLGETHPNARASDEVVAKARAMRAEGLTLPVIGEALGVSQHTVWAWVSGRRRALPVARVVARLQKVKDE